MSDPGQLRTWNTLFGPTTLDKNHEGTCTRQVVATARPRTSPEPFCHHPKRSRHQPSSTQTCKQSILKSPKNADAWDRRIPGKTFRRQDLTFWCAGRHARMELPACVNWTDEGTPHPKSGAFRNTLATFHSAFVKSAAKNVPTTGGELARALTHTHHS